VASLGYLLLHCPFALPLIYFTIAKAKLGVTCSVYRALLLQKIYKFQAIIVREYNIPSIISYSYIKNCKIDFEIQPRYICWCNRKGCF